MTSTLPIPEAARIDASEVIRTHRMRHSAGEKPACACGWVPPNLQFWGDDHRQHVADEVVAGAIPHLHHPENATYTEAQVKALTKQAGEFGYALGRKEEREEIAALCEKRLTWTANRGRRLELQDLVAELRSKGDPNG